MRPATSGSQAPASGRHDGDEVWYVHMISFISNPIKKAPCRALYVHDYFLTQNPSRHSYSSSAMRMYAVSVICRSSAAFLSARGISEFLVNLSVFWITFFFCHSDVDAILTSRINYTGNRICSQCLSPRISKRRRACDAQKKNQNAKRKPAFFMPVVLAPQVGLEPTTLRLTAECSAIELLRNMVD